jgi:hypothetical protein
MTAKNAMTQDVQPYVNMPNKTENIVMKVPLPSFLVKSTMALDKLNMCAENRLIPMLMTILMMTKYNP